VQPFPTPLLAGPLRSPHCSHGAALLPLPDQYNDDGMVDVADAVLSLGRMTEVARVCSR
jgi:hypothetical protein